MLLFCSVVYALVGFGFFIESATTDEERGVLWSVVSLYAGACWPVFVGSIIARAMLRIVESRDVKG